MLRWAPLIAIMLGILWVLVFYILLSAGLVYAHEGHGYKHATEPIGPAIGGRYCNDMTQIWTIDDNEDGVGDRCVRLIYTHNRVHVKDVPMINGKCGCWEETE